MPSLYRVRRRASLVLAAGCALLVPLQAGATDSGYQVSPARDGDAVTAAPAPPLTLRWSAAQPRHVGYPIIAGGHIVTTVQGTGGSPVLYQTGIVALDEQTGATVWGPNWLPYSVLVDIAGDATRVVSYDGTIAHAFDAGTGRQLWSRSVSGSYGAGLSLAAGVVYLAHDSGITALDAASGLVLWNTALAHGGRAVTAPAVGDGAVFIADDCNKVTATNVDGTKRWEVVGPVACDGPTYVVVHGTRLYVECGPSCPTKVYDTRTAAPLGTYDSETPPVFDGSVMVEEKGSVVTGHDVSSGAQLWSFAGDCAVLLAPVAGGGYVDVASSAGNVYVLDETTGAVVWSGQLGVLVDAAAQPGLPAPPRPGLGLGDGLLVVPAAGRLIALASGNGSLPAAPVNAGTPLAATPVPTPSQALAVTAGPDGNLWTIEGNGRIARVTPQGAVTEFTTPVAPSLSITAGSDGALWYATTGNRIGRTTTAGVSSSFPLPDQPSPSGGTATYPGRIMSGPDGALWFPEGGYGFAGIGRITTSGQVTYFPFDYPGPQPDDLTAGPDNNIWFSASRTTAGMITVQGRVVEYPVPIAAALNRGGAAIATGSDGALWIVPDRATLAGGVPVGRSAPTTGLVRLTTDGESSVLPLPAALRDPTVIAAGPDGALWFGTSRGTMGRITTTGAVSTFALPPGGGLVSDVAAGPDGNIWAIDYNGLVRVVPGGTPCGPGAVPHTASRVAATHGVAGLRSIANLDSAPAALPSTAGGTPVCGSLPSGTTTWNALGSPYQLCPAGVTVPAGATLTVDAGLGAVQVTALGAGGITVLGTMQTGATSLVNTVAFDRSASGTWAGIAVVAPPAGGGAGGTLTLANATINHAVRGVDATAASSVSLSAVTVQNTTADGVRVLATPLTMTQSSVTSPHGDGVLATCSLSGEAVSVTTTAVSGATRYGIEVRSCTHPKLQNDTVTSSGTGTPSYTAIAVRRSVFSAGPGNDVDADSGAGNGVDAILLSGWSSAAMTWVTPSNSASSHPLGYLASGLAMQSNPNIVLTVPANAVVKATSIDPSPVAADAWPATLATGGGGIIAAAGSVFTSVSDDSVGPPTCTLAVSPGCTPLPGDWGGVAATYDPNDGPAGTMTLSGATISWSTVGVTVNRLTPNSPPLLSAIKVEDAAQEGLDLQSAATVQNSAVDRSRGDGVDLGRGLSGADALSFSGLSVKDSVGSGLIGRSATLSMTASTVSGSGEFGFAALGFNTLTLTDNTFTNNGARLGFPAVYASGLLPVSPPSSQSASVSGNQGGGNGLDAIDINGWWPSSLTWSMPSPSATAHPLGLISSGGLAMGGGTTTLTIPANTAVQMGGTLTLGGATLDARAGGARFTDLSDAAPPVSAAACPLASYLGVCTADVHWGGIVLSGQSAAPNAPQGNATISGATLHHPAQGVVGQSSATSTLGSSSFGLVLTNTLIDHSGSDGIHLGDPNSYLEGTPTQVTGGSIASPAGDGIRSLTANLAVNGTSISTTGGDGIRVPSTVRSGIFPDIENVAIDHAAQIGVHVDDVRDWTPAGVFHGPLVRNTVVTNSGNAGGRYPAMSLSHIDTSLGPGGDIAGNSGGGNGVDAIVLEGDVRSDFTWITPTNSPAVHPLGYVIPDHVFASYPKPASLQFIGNHHVVFPAGSIAKLASGLGMDGGQFDAAGTTFTGFGDDSVGLPLCSPVITSLADQCGGAPHAWGGLSLGSAPFSVSNSTLLGGWIFSTASQPYPGTSYSGIVSGTTIREGGSTFGLAIHVPFDVTPVPLPVHVTHSTVEGTIDTPGGSQIDHDTLTATAPNLPSLSTYSGTVVRSVRFLNATTAISGYGSTVTCISTANGGGEVDLKGVLHDSDLYGNSRPGRYDVNGGTGSAILDARFNWWGQPGGAAPGQYSGNVDVTSPLQQGTSGASIGVSGNQQPDGSFGPGLLTVTLTFAPREMETEIQPYVTLTGPDGVAHTIPGSWQDAYHWSGTYTIGSGTANGPSRIDASQARTCVPDPSTNLMIPASAVISVSGGSSSPPPPPPAGFGYRMANAAGGVLAFGREYLGDMARQPLNRAIVGMASTPSGRGYWLVASDGGIFTFGDAQFHGSTGAMRLNQPIVGMASTPSGRGYWLVAADGGIFTFGDAQFHGSTGAMRLNQPIVGMASTPSGRGYWLVAADGGIFTFGDAEFHGSTGAIRLNQPITGMAATATAAGYWLVASDGGIFTFGDAGFFGSTGAIRLNQPVTAMVPTPDAAGYWLIARDGGVFTFGDAPFLGSGALYYSGSPVVGAVP